MASPSASSSTHTATVALRTSPPDTLSRTLRDSSSRSASSTAETRTDCARDQFDRVKVRVRGRSDTALSPPPTPISSSAPTCTVTFPGGCALKETGSIAGAPPSVRERLVDETLNPRSTMLNETVATGAAP